MTGPNIPPVRPGQPNADILRQLSKSVKSLRNMRPMASLFGTVTLPWGQAVTPGSPDMTIAFSHNGGVTAASSDSDGKLVLGTGYAYEVFPVVDESGVVSLDFTMDDDFKFPVYNLAEGTDGAVGGGHYIVLLRIWTLWFVIWEECPQS